MAISRRTFLASASSLLLPVLHPVPILAAPQQVGIVVFGYGQTGIGSRLADDIAVLLGAYYPQRRYRLYNLLGENSVKAVMSARSASTDGGVLLQMQSPQVTIFPSIYSRLPYDPLRDFKPLAITGEYTLLLTLGPLVDSSVKTLDDYVRWVQDNPDFSNLGFIQFGSPGHMAYLILQREKNVALSPQSYAGTTMIVDDLMSKHLAAALLISGNALPQFRSGQLRAIAVTSRLRHPGWDDIATCREQGIPNMNITGWYGWFAPSGMPDDIYHPLANALQSMIVSSDYLEMLRKYSLKPVYDTPREIVNRIQREQAFYAALIDDYRVSKV